MLCWWLVRADILAVAFLCTTPNAHAIETLWAFDNGRVLPQSPENDAICAGTLKSWTGALHVISCAWAHKADLHLPSKFAAYCTFSEQSFFTEFCALSLSCPTPSTKLPSSCHDAINWTCAAQKAAQGCSPLAISERYEWRRTCFQWRTEAGHQTLRRGCDILRKSERRTLQAHTRTVRGQRVARRSLALPVL